MRRRPGVYRGQCSEFCGLQHAHMAIAVVAESPARFRAWLANMEKPARPAATAEQLAGRSVFLADVMRELPHDSRHFGAWNRRARPDSSCEPGDACRADRPEHASPISAVGSRIPRRSSPGARMPSVPLSSRQLDRAHRLPLPSALMAIAAPAPTLSELERLERVWLPRPGILGWLTTVDHKRIASALPGGDGDRSSARAGSRR